MCTEGLFGRLRGGEEGWWASLARRQATLMPMQPRCPGEEELSLKKLRVVTERKTGQILEGREAPTSTGATGWCLRPPEEQQLCDPEPRKKQVPSVTATWVPWPRLLLRVPRLPCVQAPALATSLNPLCPKQWPLGSCCAKQSIPGPIKSITEFGGDRF